MAIIDDDANLNETTTNPTRCKNRKATITVSVTAEGANKRDTIREAKDRAKELKDDKIAEMKRDIHCPDATDICPPNFTCFEDPPWSYSSVTPRIVITPDDEDKPTSWTVERTFDIRASLRCECIRASLAAKRPDFKEKEVDDELEFLLSN